MPPQPPPPNPETPRRGSHLLPPRQPGEICGERKWGVSVGGGERGGGGRERSGGGCHLSTAQLPVLPPQRLQLPVWGGGRDVGWTPNMAAGGVGVWGLTSPRWRPRGWTLPKMAADRMEPPQDGGRQRGGRPSQDGGLRGGETLPRWRLGEGVWGRPHQDGGHSQDGAGGGRTTQTPLKMAAPGGEAVTYCGCPGHGGRPPAPPGHGVRLPCARPAAGRTALAGSARPVGQKLWGWPRGGCGAGCPPSSSSSSSPGRCASGA